MITHLGISVAAFMLQWQSRAIVTETYVLQRQNYFLFGPSQKSLQLYLMAISIRKLLKVLVLQGKEWRENNQKKESWHKSY